MLDVEKMSIFDKVEKLQLEKSRTNSKLVECEEKYRDVEAKCRQLENFLAELEQVSDSSNAEEGGKRQERR